MTANANSTLDLKSLERRAWLATFQDGLLDISLALLLLSGALSSWLTSRGVPDGVRIPSYLSVIGIGLALLMLGKRAVTVPRIGRARFGPERQRARKIALPVLVLLVTLTLLTWAVSTINPGSAILPGRAVAPFFVIGLILLFFCAMAYLFELHRLYIYGLLFALPEVVIQVFRPDSKFQTLAVVELLAGLSVLAVGLTLFFRFLRSYPPQAVEE